MEKIKIDFKQEIPMKEVELCGVKVQISEYISIENYDLILSDIKEVVLYNSEIEDKYAFLHWRLTKDILEYCTNIDTSSMNGEDFNNPALIDVLIQNIYNFCEVEEYIEKEYDKFVMENCFGILGNKLPNANEMNKTLDKLKETINEMDSENLETISKSIVWNNMPTLGMVQAPASHKTVGE